MRRIKYFAGIVGVLIGILVIGRLGSQAAGPKTVPQETLQQIGPQLAKAFTFEPFSPPLPDHLWMKADQDRVVFLHFAKPVMEKDNKLIFVGDGIKGRFCADDQPAKGKTGYVHFHSLAAPAGHQHGHGGDQGQEGYWLRHVAVAEFEMMGTRFTPGTAMNFMPTAPPKC